MDKISGYVVANDKGGYDVITKTSQTKPFVIPGHEVPSPSGKKISGRIVENGKGGYDVIAKTPQTSKKPFTIPTQEIPNEKPTQTYKLTQKLSSNLEMVGALTYRAYDKFNPFEDIAKTGSFSIPDLMQTKTTPKRSDAEILKDMEKLAREHAITGEYEKNDKYDKRFAELIDEYVSSASPDREGILKKSIKEINERIAAEMPGMAGFEIGKEEKDNKKEPIDYFIEALKNIDKGSRSVTKNGNYYTVNVDYGDGRKTALNYTSSGEFVSMQMQGNNYFVGGIDNLSGAVTAAEFFDDNGDLIFLFDGSNMSQVYTKAEGERLQEIRAAYGAAFRSESDYSYSGAYENIRSGVALAT